MTDTPPGASGSSPGVSPEFEAIVQELRQPARRTDMTHRAQLCRQALTFVVRDEDPRRWAALQGELGNSLSQSLSGDRGEPGAGHRRLPAGAGGDDPRGMPGAVGH